MIKRGHPRCRPIGAKAGWNLDHYGHARGTVWNSMEEAWRAPPRHASALLRYIDGD
jgi:hypothetical protein